MCQNSPFYEVTLATDSCSEGDFLFIRVLTHPPREHLCRRIGRLSSAAFATTGTGAASCIGFRADVESSDSGSGCLQERASCILCSDGEGIFAIGQTGRNNECEL